MRPAPQPSCTHTCKGDLHMRKSLRPRRRVAHETGIVRITYKATWKWQWSRSGVSDSLRSVDCSPPGSLSMGFPRQEYWSGLPFPSPGDLPDPGIEPGSPAFRQTFYPLSHQGRWHESILNSSPILIKLNLSKKWCYCSSSLSPLDPYTDTESFWWK